MISPEQLAQLRAVNVEVNAIPYDALPSPGEAYDVWKDTPDAGTWECRDYVLTKAEQLRARGWPQSALSVVLCYTEPPDPEYHAVLAVDAGGETWVLDSRTPVVYRWDEPVFAYRWERRQVPGTSEFRAIA